MEGEKKSEERVLNTFLIVNAQEKLAFPKKE